MARVRKKALSELTVAAKKKIWRIALYIRLSRDDGNDESLSVSNQRKILIEFVEKAFQEAHTLADVYVDDGQSGTDYERPDFQRMIHDIETGKVNCIICKNLSRAFRNYADQGYFLESFFPRFNTRFITLGDPKVDTFINPEAVSGMEVPINGLMNDRFAYKTSSDIRRTFDNKRRNGAFIGAFAPYGYSKDAQDKNQLVIDQEAAQIVRDIFRWYVYGDESTAIAQADTELEAPKGSMSKEGIARKLNALGVLNPAAYKRSKGMKYHNPKTDQNDGLWQGTGIAAILSNEMYIGTMVQGKQRVISYKVHDKVPVPENEWYRVSDMHEPIVEKKLFELAQEKQKKDIRRAPGKKQNYLFSGFLKCNDCHKAMTRKPSKDLVYYNCSTYKRKSKTKCTIHSIRLDVLEAAVLTAVQKQIEAFSDLTRIIETINQAPAAAGRATRLDSLLKLRARELEKSENAAAELYIDWKNKDITRDQYQKLKVRFESQTEQLKGAIQHIQEEILAMGEGSAADHPYLKSFLKHKNIQTLTQGILAELVKDIFVHENGALTIVFKFADPYRRLAD